MANTRKTGMFVWHDKSNKNEKFQKQGSCLRASVLEDFLFTYF